MPKEPLLGLGALALAIVVAILVQVAVFWVLRRRFRGDGLQRRLVDTADRPVMAAVALFGMLLVTPGLRWSSAALAVLHEVITLAAIAVIAWLLIALVRMAEEIAMARFDISAPDNLSARRVRTRLGVIRRVATLLVIGLSVSSALMTFPEVRTLGASLLASAGLVGLVAGFAAQPLLTNLIAGLQIALTQPIKIDDVVVINGDWGWIERIDSTYIVVRIWDLRRLIVPLSYFLQNPIENWTYRSADILGYAYVYADYRVSVDAVRAELERILRASANWDGKTWSLQVTGMDERAVQLRALFSASDSNLRWNLIVEVQEKLIAFLQAHYPEYLPTTRVEVHPPKSSDPGGRTAGTGL